MNKCRWINRDLIQSPFYLGLCITEDQFKRELKRIKVPANETPLWVVDGKDGAIHLFTDKQGRGIAIVCIKPSPHVDEIQVIGLLIHEAVHVWQDIKKDMGEYDPSPEFEAYSIQNISVRLIDAYAQLTGNSKQKKNPVMIDGGGCEMPLV